jgi:UDP-N-acetylmuramoyl-tripeptide--D-alanyl-D-alanine ligase
MIALTLDDVVVAVRGQLRGASDSDPAVSKVLVTEVVTDSRLAVPGALFVALAGEHTDGHDHVAAAVRAGAVAVLVARPVVDEHGEEPMTVLVPDPLLAMGDLARAVVDRLPHLTVIGVTGSTGKTSTKDLLAHLLADLGPTVAPANSFNNELGVPVTVLRCTEQTRYLVAEMGAREPGNIAYLCGVARPRIGVVLNVGAAHSGVFGGLEITAATKGELPAALPPDGVAVLNVDDPLVAAMAARTSARVVRVGAGGTVRARDVEVDSQARAAFTLEIERDGVVVSAPVRLDLHGEHHVGNALAAAAVAVELGAPPARVAELLGTAQAMSRGRMALTQRADGVTVVDDAYNANPDSVRAALTALTAMARHGERRSWAVLGEMLELGPAALTQHDDLGRLAVRLGISRLVAVGEGGRGYHQGATREGTPKAVSTWVPDQAAALDLLRRELAPGDVVLVKASRAIGLDVLARALVADGAPERLSATATVEDRAAMASAESAPGEVAP